MSAGKSILAWRPATVRIRKCCVGVKGWRLSELISIYPHELPDVGLSARNTLNSLKEKGESVAKVGVRHCPCPGGEPAIGMFSAECYALWDIIIVRS